MNLIHVLTCHGITNFRAGPNCKYSKDSARTSAVGYSERFCLVKALATNYSQPRLVFCHQYLSKFFLNNTHTNISFYLLKPLAFVSQVDTVWFAIQICTPWTAILGPQTHAFVLFQLCLFSQSTEPTETGTRGYSSCLPWLDFFPTMIVSLQSCFAMRITLAMPSGPIWAKCPSPDCHQVEWEPEEEGTTRQASSP